MVKSGVATMRLLLRRRRPPQRGAQAGEQLVHAERLGDVVVGAGVERGDLVALAVAHREHDDRHRASSRAGPSITSMPSMPGSPRSRTTTSGWWRAASVERVLAGRGEVDVVATRLQVDPERPQDLRLVVDDEDAASSLAAPSAAAMTIVSPPPGVSSIVELAAHRLDEPARHREAEPDARAVAGRVAEPLERLEHRARGRRGGMPGPRSTTRRSTRSCDRARLDADRAIAGRRGNGVVDEVGDRALEQRGIGVHARQRLGTSTLDPIGASGRGSRAPPGRPPRARPPRRLRSSAPVWSRLMSSRLPTSALSRSVSSSIVSRNSRASRRRPGHVLAAAGSSPTP